MYRWCAKHGRMVMFLWSVSVSAIIWVLFLDIDAPIWFPALFTFIMVFTAWGFVNSCARKLLLRAGKALSDQCDPYPLLKEAQEQMTYNLTKSYKPILLIDYCAALRSIGEYNQVLEKLEGINIDKYAGLPYAVKTVYYNNLSDIYLCINEFEKAEVWHNKSNQMLHDLKNQKLKQMLSTPIQHNAAEIAYYKKDYEKSIEILDNCAERNMKEAVYEALLRAKIYISQDKIVNAKTELAFVIENGNNMIDVQIAKDLITQIST